MSLMPRATNILQWDQQWAAKPQGGANPIKWSLSWDWGLQLDPMNAELVVIADQQAAVNTFSPLAHTARHFSKVKGAQNLDLSGLR